MFKDGEFGKLVVDVDVVDMLFENPNAATTNAIQRNTNPNLTGLISFERTDGGSLFATGGIAAKIGEVVVATVTTAGDVVISGDLADVSTAVWDAQTSSHEAPGTMGGELAKTDDFRTI